MRTFNKHHIKDYKKSKFSIVKYKNISDEELLKL